MRTSSERKNWDKVFKRNYDHFIKSVNLNGAGGITNMEFNKGIFAICGLNGAGKSTIISSLKDVLGIDTNQQDINKVMGKNIEAKINNKSVEIDITNIEGHRFTDLVDKNSSLRYIDYKQSNSVLEQLEQTNLEEYLEQFETIVLEESDIKKINYIVGKDYDEITLIEIEDGEETIPYFKTKIFNFEYDSLGMGMGEHFLFYIFWVFYRIAGNGVILIEEPETFVSVKFSKKINEFYSGKDCEFREYCDSFDTFSFYYKKYNKGKYSYTQ